ncbi:hypothetical protein BKA70DRAFT_1332046 [Coprinopsis sp. MPI-PUGE-AT-0042]|nr:hypothetical protein BKA70DRAFT_1332046 [Coprinopsis sp. MPI-PUGE-AT-0042]
MLATPNASDMSIGIPIRVTHPGEVVRQGQYHTDSTYSHQDMPRSQPEATTHPYNLNTSSYPGRGSPGTIIPSYQRLKNLADPLLTGIGSIPGSNYEAGVTTPPEEREDGRPYSTFRSSFEDYSLAKGILYSKVNESEAYGNSVDTESSARIILRRTSGGYPPHRLLPARAKVLDLSQANVARKATL